MVSKTMMGGGAILLAILIVLTVVLSLPETLHYIWALVALVWGILTFMDKGGEAQPTPAVKPVVKK